jgi:flagellar motility protein MotE (MotC chaperone)
MNKIASNPIVLIVLGLVLGVGAGLFTFWQAAVPLVRAARAAKAKPAHAERPEAPWDFWTIEIENLSNELKDLRATVRKREEELSAREQRLAAEREELNKQRAEIEALRGEINGRMIEIQADELKNLKSLTALYSNLTPKATLTIFNEMDDLTVVKLLALMKTDTVGPLFEEMSRQAAADPAAAKRAAVLTEKLRLYKAAKPAGAP